jgi:hypothetical protein
LTSNHFFDVSTFQLKESYQIIRPVALPLIALIDMEDVDKKLSRKSPICGGEFEDYTYQKKEVRSTG